MILLCSLTFCKMEGIRKVTVENREIFVVDYSGCTESEMIKRASRLTETLIRENKKCLILSVFDDKSYATPQYMRHVEKLAKENIHFIGKMAMTGLSDTKKLLLKGFNFFLRKNYQAFDTEEAAIRYLLDENTEETPSWFRNLNWP
jgi:hypothetical protein